MSGLCIKKRCTLIFSSMMRKVEGGSISPVKRFWAENFEIDTQRHEYVDRDMKYKQQFCYTEIKQNISSAQREKLGQI